MDPVDPEGGHESCGIDSAHLIDILAGLAHSNFNHFILYYFTYQFNRIAPILYALCI